MESRFSQNTVRSRWGHVVALIALVAGVVGYYFDYLAGKAFIWEDMAAYYFPVTHYFCTAVAGGRFPFWLPGLLNGVPLYTDFQVALYYPFRWLLVLFVHNGELPILVYQWYIVLHIGLGALLMYGYLTSHRLRPLSCLVGSLVFCFAGFSALQIIHNPMLKVYAWLPLQLWLVDKAVATRRARYYAGLTLAIFLSVCAGFPQTTLYDSYLVIAYWLYRRYRTLPEQLPRTGAVICRHLAAEGGRIAGVLMSVLLLSAILILPTVEHWRLSSRRELGFAGMAAQSLPPRNLIQLAVPNFFMFFDTVGRGRDYWSEAPAAQPPFTPQPGPYCEFGVYAGQLALIALAVVVVSRHFRQTAPVLFFAIAGAMALWFMLGRFGGLFTVLYHSLPGIALFRTPTRMAGVVDCCAAVLVAFVVEAAASQTNLRLGRAGAIVFGLYTIGIGSWLQWGDRIYPEFRAAVPAAFVKSEIERSLLLLLGTAGAVWVLRSHNSALRRIGGGLLAILTFADLYSAYGFHHRWKVNPDQYFDTNLWTVEGHKQYVRTHGPTRFAQSVDGHFGQFAVDVNLPLIETSLETPQGYFDLILRPTAQIQRLTNQTVLLDLQNVGMLVSQNSKTGRQVADCRPNCLPRVKFYPTIRCYDSDQSILRDLDAGTLDYQRVVAVRADELRAVLPSPAPGGNSAGDRVALIQRTPEHYQIRYSAGSPGIIYVAESYYPGWKVTDESGHPVQLVHAFVAFKGIVIPTAGHGTLDVQFRPQSFFLGAAITGSTGLALVVFYGWLFRQERRRVRRTGAAPVRFRPESALASIR